MEISRMGVGRRNMANLSKNIITGLLLPLAMVFIPPKVEANELAAEPRLSTTTIAGATTYNRYQAAAALGEKNQSVGQKRTTRNHNHGLWFFDVLINLTNDHDYDGHYSSFTVSIDLEGSFSPRLVYAVLYISHNGGAWTEYAVTNNFNVTGSGIADTIEIETTLESGYTSGYYDHYIEIFDAYDDTLLLSYGPNDSQHVNNLPFESYYDDLFYTGDDSYYLNTTFHSGGYYSHSSYHSPLNVSLSLSGTGSFTPYPIAGLLALLAYRRRLKSRMHN